MGTTELLKTLMVLVFCHLVGDYVLQSNFLATTKGENWYHLFVHCALYCLPFVIVFSITWQLAYIFVIHVVTDTLKARYHKIGYVTDQIVHYVAMLCYLAG